RAPAARCLQRDWPRRGSPARGDPRDGRGTAAPAGAGGAPAAVTAVPPGPGAHPARRHRLHQVLVWDRRNEVRERDGLSTVVWLEGELPSHEALSSAAVPGSLREATPPSDAPVTAHLLEDVERVLACNQTLVLSVPVEADGHVHLFLVRLHDPSLRPP